MTRALPLTDARLAEIADRLREGRPVRRAMPGWGRLAVDRALPFVVLYRRPGRGADPGTDRLAVGVAGSLLASGQPQSRDDVARVVETLAEVARESFGALLVIEVWAGPEPEESGTRLPAYRICTRRSEPLPEVADELASALSESRILGVTPNVSVEPGPRVAPRGMRQILDGRKLASLGAHLIGLEVAPAFRDADGDLFPGVLRQMRRRITTALDRAAYRFTHEYTTQRPAHYLALGKRSFVRAVREIDAELAEIGAAYDLLLQVSPVNTEAAFAEFRRRRYQRAPRLRYRPLPFDPGRMKHRLWAIRPERVEDPTLMYLFRGVQRQLDRELTLLADIDTPEFLHTSLQIHGGVEAGLLALAETLLASLSPRPPRSRRAARLSADEFAGLAAAELLSYREEHPGFGVMPKVRDDVFSGVMVSHGRVLIGSGASVPAIRADALIQHEIGTHVVTWHNGRKQPLQLLSVGLPGYDELQEGLAVLGEYLAGGLDAERMRMLAGRVVAVHALTQGAEFVDCFRMLVDRGFGRHTAYGTTVRVFRGGGLAKDAMYLRGLASVLDYAAEGNDLTRLFVGKFALKHVPVIDELLLREVLSPPEVLPRYLHRPDAAERLAGLSAGLTVTELVKGRTRR